MSSTPAFVSRLVRLPLLDVDGGPIGRIDDVLIVPAGTEPPKVLGFVALVQRRRIFVNAARVADVEPSGLRMRTGTIDLHPFRQRSGELLARADLFDQRVGTEFLTDLSIAQSEQYGSWVVVSVALGRRGPLRSRRSPHIVPWSEVAETFRTTNPELEEVAELRELHPSDVASRLRALPLAKRQRLAELLEDDRLADLIEELPDEEAVRIIEGLDIARAAHVLEEMEPDDAADLLGVLPEEERSLLLEAMQPEESTPLRRLLSYDEDSAGGLMTPEPVILSGTATVAEALAVVRTREIPSELAAQVFVVRPPTSTPTGTLLGVVGFQRLLREPPATPLEQCVNAELAPVSPDLPLRDVAERLASYDLLAVPVCDEAGRLVGAVTVDDVLDQVLPEGWRRVARR
ncbi:MAG: magnesium transporter [Acidimicrobiales bacterium]|nr:magnesium transporter [Acidimicrobiales bacterium]